MDCHLIQPYHCISICFTNQCDVLPEELLARQSCSDSWWQHIKGLCGSAVSSNGLCRSFLLSGFSSQAHIITTELLATKCWGQAFKGNGIGSKQRYYCYSTSKTGCSGFLPYSRASASTKEQLPQCVSPSFGMIFMQLVVWQEFFQTHLLFSCY